MSNVCAVAVLLALLVLGSGCSVKFAYNNLDRIARWGVSDYIDLNDQQRRYFDSEFAKLHYWHRTQHLTQYADLLESLPTTFGDGVDVDELIALEHTMIAWGDELEERATPMVVELMRSMSDEQVAQLPKKLEASNREIAKPEMNQSLETSQIRWRDEIADMFARFAGRLSPEQRKHLTSQSVRYLPERTLWADYRRRWQADLLALLEQRQYAARFAERYRRLAADRETYYGAELAHIVDRNETLAREVAVWLLNNMTHRQQQRLFEQLLDFAISFRELADQADGAAPRGDSCLLSC